MPESSSDFQDDVPEDIPPTQNDSLVTRMAGPSAGKAGLSTFDKDSINKRIYELSKGSKFFENEKLKDAQLTEKINRLLEEYKSLNMKDLSCNLPIIANLEQELENDRDLSQIIVHVDMDAFYASVEILDNPKLHDKPVAVGGMSMLCTASYEARKFGVRAAMPGFIGKELCPELIIVPCNFSRYKEMSGKVQEVFAIYDPHYRQVSLDEAYLNITKFCEENSKDPQEVVQQLREEILNKTKLTASAGIGANGLIAKICSDFNKPNGQTFVPFTRDAILGFMSPLSIRKINGIGRVTERVLNAIGVKVCKDIYEHQTILYSLLSEKTFNFLLASCLGISGSKTTSSHTRKSISTERTFRTLSTWEELTTKLGEIAASLAEDLEHRNLAGKTITLKIKTPGFQVKVKGKTLPHSIHTQEDLYLYGEKLLKQEFPVSMRLMGLRLSNLVSRDKPSSQPTIMKFLEKNHKENILYGIDDDQESCSDVEIIELPEKESVIEKVITMGNPGIKTDLVTEEPEVSILTYDSKNEFVPDVFKCPSCNQIFVDVFSSLEEINLHLDKCLEASLKVKKASNSTNHKKNKNLHKEEDNSNNSSTILSFFHKRPTPKKTKHS